MKRTIAIYLPQYHPIPENDEWWGKGFTEWTNVTKAKPLFKGHYQPHLPADLGFYDLRLNDTFRRQINLARYAGIHGFMFYHYWFNGKRLLETPLENYLRDSSLDFPFFLCWANENWTKRWDGMDSEVLICQKYSKEDHLSQFKEVISRFIVDSRYILVNGKPVVGIYRPEQIPDVKQFTMLWNELARQLGFPGIYFIKVSPFKITTDLERMGIDASVDFQPDWDKTLAYKVDLKLGEKIFRYILKSKLIPKRINRAISRKFLRNFSVIDYEKYIEDFISGKSNFSTKLYPCVMPSWDNSSRRVNNATVFINSTPDLYGKWLRNMVDTFSPFSEDENFIFINAWNEWAEGCHLEPCIKWGDAYLVKTKSVLNNV